MSYFTKSFFRRKWVRRSRYIAEFVFAFIYSIVENTYKAIYGIAKAIKKRKKHRRIETPKKRNISSNTAQAIEKEKEIFKPFKMNKNMQQVRFSDIAGLQDVKREIRLRMILPLTRPDLAKKHGVEKGGGVLLYGPPGTGKTMLAKAVASEIKVPFYHVRVTDIVTNQVGQAEKNVQILFATLRRHPVVILFIDEVEALIPARSKNNSTIMQRVISQFLSELDGLEKIKTCNILLIGATNEPNKVDKAMLRPGRLDAKIFVGPPDKNARRYMINKAISNKNTSQDFDLERIINETEGLTGAEIMKLMSEFSMYTMEQDDINKSDCSINNNIASKIIENIFEERDMKESFTN